MMMRIMKYEDCEPSLDVYWANLDTINELHSFEYAAHLIPGYWEFEENRQGGKTAKDQELDIRAHNLDIKLIAVDFTDTEKQMIADGHLVFIKPQFMHLYTGKDKLPIASADESHRADRSIIISCRSPDDYTAEMLSHRSSNEQNLEYLVNAGHGQICRSDTRWSNSKPDESTEIKLRKCKCRISINYTTPHDEFEHIIATVPGASVELVAMNQNGPISGIVKNGTLISRIGVQMVPDEHGKMVENFVFIENE